MHQMLDTGLESGTLPETCKPASCTSASLVVIIKEMTHISSNALCYLAQAKLSAITQTFSIDLMSLHDGPNIVWMVFVTLLVHVYVLNQYIYTLNQYILLQNTAGSAQGAWFDSSLYNANNTPAAVRSQGFYLYALCQFYSDDFLNDGNLLTRKHNMSRQPPTMCKELFPSLRFEFVHKRAPRLPSCMQTTDWKPRCCKRSCPCKIVSHCLNRTLWACFVGDYRHFCGPLDKISHSFKQSMCFQHRGMITHVACK